MLKQILITSSYDNMDNELTTLIHVPNLRVDQYLLLIQYPLQFKNFTGLR